VSTTLTYHYIKFICHKHVQFYYKYASVSVIPINVSGIITNLSSQPISSSAVYSVATKFFHVVGAESSPEHVSQYKTVSWEGIVLNSIYLHRRVCRSINLKKKLYGVILYL